MSKKIMFLFAMVLAIAFSVLLHNSVSYAVGTASDTNVGFTATMQASNSVSIPNSTSTTAMVYAVHGFATSTFVDPANGATSSAGIQDYVFSIQNRGNASMGTNKIKLNTGAFSFGAGAGTTANWTLQADDQATFVSGLTWATSALTTAAQAGDNVLYPSALAPGAYATYTLRVTTAGDAGDTSTMTVSVQFETTETGGKVGLYQGLNSNQYGGPATWPRQLNSGLLQTQIQGPILGIAKSASITSPAGYQALGGGANDPVPGSRITYTVTFQNTGSGNAINAMVRDGVPTNTTFESGTIQSCFSAIGCSVGADNSGDANGANPDCYITGTTIECNMDTLNAAGGGKLQYSVTID